MGHQASQALHRNLTAAGGGVGRQTAHFEAISLSLARIKIRIASTARKLHFSGDDRHRLHCCDLSSRDDDDEFP